MKDNNNFYFLLTLLAMLLAGFLLFKIYDAKKTQQNLQKEYESYKTEQEKKEEWAEAQYWNFAFKYPYGWHVALFFTNDSRQTKTYAISPYPINMASVGYSKGIYELTIYEDPNLFNDEFWKKTQEDYLKELDFIESREIEAPYGHINYYKAKEGQDTAPGQNVEAYFYKFTYSDQKDGGNTQTTIYLKLELLYIEDAYLTQTMKEIALSIKPI